MQPGFSEDLKKRIPHPERVTRIVMVSGVMGMVFFLICGGILLFFFNSFLVRWNVPSAVIVLAFAVLAWTGFNGGVRSGQRLIAQILHDAS